MLAPPDFGLVRKLGVGAGARAWWTPLELAPAARLELTALLSADEVARAASYADSARGERFTVGRSVLRFLLGEVTGVAARDLAFVSGEHGKPSLAGPPALLGIHFNLSHAKGLVVVATALGRRVGIDVAWVGGGAPIDRVAERFFSPAERSALHRAPAELRRECFHRIWVRKEALLKGIGAGISPRIYETDFSSPAGTVHELEGPSARDGERWEVSDVTGLPPGYVASIAVERSTG